MTELVNRRFYKSTIAFESTWSTKEKKVEISHFSIIGKLSNFLKTEVCQ